MKTIHVFRATDFLNMTFIKAAFGLLLSTIYCASVILQYQTFVSSLKLRFVKSEQIFISLSIY